MNQPEELPSAPPVVSVLIPVYNRAAFIRQTVQSVLDQTYQNFELIAIDDGSTDESREVLESFGARIKILEHPGRSNRGQSAAINLGLESAHGMYIAILDSDDLWLPQKLERMVEFLEAHPEVGLLYSNGWSMNALGERQYQIYDVAHVEVSDPARILLDCYIALPSNSIVRREAFQKAGGFDETLRSAQDHDMLVRIAEVTRLAYMPEPLWCYRRHDFSISHSAGGRRWENGFKILEKARKRYRYSKYTVRKRRAVLHFRLGQVRITEKRWTAALGCFIASFLNDPVRAVGVVLGNERISSHKS